jgi:hypothetical protein
MKSRNGTSSHKGREWLWRLAVLPLRRGTNDAGPQRRWQFSVVVHIDVYVARPARVRPGRSRPEAEKTYGLLMPIIEPGPSPIIHVGS